MQPIGLISKLALGLLLSIMWVHFKFISSQMFYVTMYSAVNEATFSSALTCLLDKLLTPFELNDSCHQHDNENIYTEFQRLNFFTQCITQCDYVVENNFVNEMTNCVAIKNLFMCYLNIISVIKNLYHFANNMELLNRKFDIISFTKTSLKNEDCDSYMVHGDRMVV